MLREKLCDNLGSYLSNNVRQVALAVKTDQRLQFSHVVGDAFAFVNFLKYKRDIHYDGFTGFIGLFLKPFTTAYLDFHLKNTIVYK